MKVYYHPQFRNSYQKLSLNIRKITETKEQIFRKNPFDQRLKTHKLHGKLKNLWSFSVGNRSRVIFEFDGLDVIFLDIGNHKIYR
ncbi:hypothetical protein A3K33_02970 [Candidatus Azambacteria bacterium RIFOXYC1_FULL_41_20]|nr:MAG: hypothetical protein A3K28_02990 [Candidatus Azambacteria bacterium RIFOXYB1_FULL_40_33]OGD42044.1 MAG: hypothetical protein A3I82_02095 [Candidatus Azambacteria bacterium RIFCSPLOWO2_02_FULL_42_10]OGD42830.1 MAG: hypothetical protein A2193_02985 [Candidatus Azambacteria bacterium RIFOXYA1_FULL_42_37]OGD43944.1 MAG: hypothetical protein A3K33_02970 [Candidatus Azambacteria bacterium RIFOXYC1_FULL_41_20]OGD47737.1 MAG: hypothetical protein A3K35_02970 [Candidatus Azambacteria bacterium R